MNFSRRDFLKTGLSTIIVSGLMSCVVKRNVIINPKKFSLHDLVINTEKFSLYEYPVKSYSNDKLEIFSEFMIHYGTPPSDLLQELDLFRHPVPEVSKERLDCKDDRWEHTNSKMEMGKFLFYTECMDMDNVPNIVKYVRLALNDDLDLMAIFYFRDNLKRDFEGSKNYYGEDGSAVIVFHFDLLKDKSYHLKQLKKLQNYIL